MTKKEYNGWTNYETWLVNLWIDSTEGGQTYWIDRAREVVLEASEADNFFTLGERATLDLSKAMEEEYKSVAGEVLLPAFASSSVWCDLLNAALSEVNWHEIAEHMIENCKEAA